MYNEGISKVGDLLDIGVERDIIEKRGSFYSYNDQRIAQGRENAKAFLRDNQDIADELEMKIRTATAVDAVENKDET
jgi:recombination protein RecA